MKKWGDANDDGKIDAEEVGAFLYSDKFKEMTNCEATDPVIAKVAALAKAYDANDDSLIQLNELQAIKDSGFCDCLCVVEEDDIEKD